MLASPKLDEDELRMIGGKTSRRKSANPLGLRQLRVFRQSALPLLTLFSIGSESKILRAQPGLQSSSTRTPPIASDAANDLLETHLELELPVRCGSLAMFVDRLRSRSTRIRFADKGANRTVLARISPQHDGTYRATMTLLYPDGHSSSRIIEASSCLEAVEALALVTAVALDPLSDTAAPSSLGSEPAETSSPPPSPPRKEPAMSPRLPPPKQPEIEDTKPSIIGVGISFVTHRGPTPGWANGFEPSLRWIAHDASGFSPSARFGFSYVENRGIQTAGGTADFALTAFTAELCPWQLRVPLFEFRGGALAHVGLVSSEGRATEAPERHRRWYITLGGLAELALLPSRFLAVPVRAVAEVPLVRDAYTFQPEVFYRVPRVGFGVAAGLEVRFQ